MPYKTLQFSKMLFLKYFFQFIIFLLITVSVTKAQKKLNNILPVRAFCISAPRPQNVDRFVKFITEELPLNNINTLILRVDYNYQFKTHPELSDSIALSIIDVKKMVTACKQLKIQLIPQINLLGHQSWAGTTGNLLKKYPQFDETPLVKLPVLYVWPNPDSLYCKSYCPLHPDVHPIIFSVIDEICAAFESTTFHAGMDEVFYLGDNKCPRCATKDKAVLFAGEVNNIQKHLTQNNIQLMIWGDRLIDGRTTGVGEWEGSYNNTAAAINLISKKVIICDWHYDKAEKTAIYFADNGFKVISCIWKNSAVAIAQTKQIMSFRNKATAASKFLYRGIMQTVWTNTTAFLDEYYALKAGTIIDENTENSSFKSMVNTIAEIKAH